MKKIFVSKCGFSVGGDAYLCEKCNTAYYDKEEALKCESVHILPEAIISQRYSFGIAEPVEITVKMQNGEEVQFANTKLPY